MNNDLSYLRMAIETAVVSHKKGNLPFGCILVGPDGKILLKGENTIVTQKDSLGHAEINLIRKASRKFSFDFLNTCTIYTSDEPCPMCASAIFWSGIGKLVYGLSKSVYYQITGRDNPNFVFEIPCREIFQRGGRKVEVRGPLLEEEAAALHIEKR